MQEINARDGRKLAVESVGAPDGEPVFLLHGTPGSLTGPRPRASILYRQGIRLISYSRPGYAGSDPLKGRKVRDASDDVEDIANYFEIKRFSVVGRSGGAPHALACAAELQGRVICVAALCSLAPYQAPGLVWTEGMAPSNVKAYKEAEADTSALIATISAHREELRASTEGLLQFLGPELESSDRSVIGDVALRRLIAETHADAVRGGIDGWVDDVLALGNQSGWGFDLQDVLVPVLLWHGADDKFSPPSHAEWLARKIRTATLDMQPTLAHFDAVKILPSILSWVLRKVDEDPDKAASGSDHESSPDLVLAGF